MPEPRPSSREKVRAHRERMRALGLRQVTRWVIDTRAPGFAAEAIRQSRLASRSTYAEEDRAFLDWLSEGVLEGEADYDWGPHGPPAA